MAKGKQLGLFLRFLYGYLKGFIAVSVFYMVMALVIILLDPQEFSLYIIKFIKTEEYSKLQITLLGHLLMVFYGIYELILLEQEQKSKKRRRLQNE